MLWSNSTARWDIPFPRPGCTLDVQIKCSNQAREMATCLRDWPDAPFVETVKTFGDEIEPASGLTPPEKGQNNRAHINPALID
jgi:hypothetical protein